MVIIHHHCRFVNERCVMFETMKFIIDSKMVETVTGLNFGEAVNLIVFIVMMSLSIGFLILCVRNKCVFEFLRW